MVNAIEKSVILASSLVMMSLKSCLSLNQLFVASHTGLAHSFSLLGIYIKPIVL